MLDLFFEIEQTDALFWQELNKILTFLKINKYHIINDYFQTLEQIQSLLVCQTGNIIDNHFITDNTTNDYTSFYSIAWVTPFYRHGQCKNRLYYKDNRIHLTRIAHGQNISHQQANLLKTKVLYQPVMLGDEVERNFVIDVNDLKLYKLS